MWFAPRKFALRFAPPRLARTLIVALGWVLIFGLGLGLGTVLDARPGSNGASALTASPSPSADTSPAGRQLARTAGAIAAAPGFVADLTHQTFFAGPDVPQNTILHSQVTYARPDRLLSAIAYPKFNAAGQEKTFHYLSLTIGNSFFINRIDEDPGWQSWRTPLNEGLDLVSANGLPTFLAHAQVSNYAPSVSLNGRDLVHLIVAGAAADLPGALYHDYLAGTLNPVVAELWIDPATDLPVELVTTVGQVPVEPGQQLIHQFTFVFSDWSAGPIPSPEPLAPSPSPLEVQP